MLVIYGGCLEYGEVVCVGSVEELRSWLGRAVVVVVGDEELARELQVAYFTREEWEEFVNYFRLASKGGYAHEDRVAVRV